MEKVFKKRFFVSWLLGSVAMFTLSYLWHGILLNDFDRLTYPVNIFLVLAVIVYLAIGFGMTFLISFVKPKMNLIRKGVLFGGAVGSFVFLIAFIFGISFNSSTEIYYYLVDFGWQIFEQAVGGVVCSFIYIVVARRERRVTI